MARIYAVLDEDVDYGFKGGPRYKTNVGDYPNRLEDRDSEWKYPKHEFNASWGDISDEKRDHVLAGFHVCRGRKHSIMFKDWNDFEIVDQPLIVLPATTAPIQLYKTYTPYGPDYMSVRPIQAFKHCNIVDVDDNLVAGTLDEYTGLFTPDLEWSADPYFIRDAEFYVWVRYDNDYSELTINSWRANTAKVSFVEDPFDFLPENVPNSWDD